MSICFLYPCGGRAGDKFGMKVRNSSLVLKANEFILISLQSEAKGEYQQVMM